MATRGVEKRKRPVNDREQEPKRLDLKKQPKINGKGRKKRVKDDNSDEEEDNGGDSESSNDEDNYDDNGSQKRRMMLFEQKLKAMKKQKKSSSESGTVKFKKSIKSKEENLISYLQEQKAKIKSDALDFSKTLTTLVHSAFGSSFPGLLTRPTTSSPDFIQNQRLHAHQVSTTALSARLLTSVQSLQATLTRIADRDLVLGQGWEQDGDLSISALHQSQQAALVKLTGMVLKGGDDSVSKKEETGEVQWKSTVKRSTKGISRLLKNLPVPTVDKTGV